MSGSSQTLPPLDDQARLRAYIERSRRTNALRLPPEGRLAEEVGVTRSRLRSLLKKLEAEGLIWRHVGKGTFVGERSLTSDLGSLHDLLNPPDAFEARLVIEPQLAALAAIRASPKEIADMRDCLHQMSQLSTFDEWAVWDERLHRLVAKAARNPLLLALYDTVREASPSGMRDRLQTVLAGGPQATTNDEHEAYVEAIAGRDPERAEALMRAHLQSIRRVLFGDR